ncbi:MAG: adenylyl-sulfate kinase [Rikenellaceae bacterium]
MKNTHKACDNMLSRKGKENLLKQHSVALWLTGLSGSGKSSIAVALERKLEFSGFLCRILDDDNLYSEINKNAGFSTQNREVNIRKIAEITKLFVNSGVIIIAVVKKLDESMRQMAKKIIGDDDFTEIYLSTSIEDCERQEVEGLYPEAHQRESENFALSNSPFEAPSRPAIVIDTTDQTIEMCVDDILDILLPIITEEL